MTIRMISDLFACEHWLQLLINFRSEVAKSSSIHLIRFLIFKWQQNPNRVVTCELGLNDAEGD